MAPVPIKHISTALYREVESSCHILMFACYHMKKIAFCDLKKPFLSFFYLKSQALVSVYLLFDEVY